MNKNILVLALIFVGSSLNIYGQIRELDREEFYSSIRAANEKSYNSSRREKKKLTIYSKDEVTSTTEEIEEFILPEKRRYILVETERGKTEKLELIKIGNKFYQKKNNGRWTKEKQWNLGDRLTAIPVPIKSLYTVEQTAINGQPVRLLKFYAVFNDSDSKDGGQKQTFYEDKTWVSEDGLKVREEITMGKLQSKEIISSRVYEYEYELKKLKIEAPIK